MALASMLIGGGLSVLSSAISNYSQGKADKAEATRIMNSIKKYDALVKEGGMDLPTALARIDEQFSAMGGALNAWYTEQLDLGTKQIESQTKSYFDKIDHDIDRAEVHADRSERDYLEQEKTKLTDLRKDFDASNQHTKNALGQQRMGASGAMIAAMKESQETYGKIQTQFADSKSKYFRGIAEGLSDTREAGIFSKQQATDAANRSSMGLNASLAGQYAQQKMMLDREKYGASEGARQNNISHELNKLAMENKADALNDTPGLGESLLQGIGGAAGSIGPSLFGTGAKDLAKSGFTFNSLNFGGAPSTPTKGAGSTTTKPYDPTKRGL